MIVTDVHAISDLNDEYNRDFMAAAQILFLSDDSQLTSPASVAKSLQERYQSEIIVVGMGERGSLLAVRKDDFIGLFPAVFTWPVINTIRISGKDGVFAEYFTLPVRNLHAIPDSLSDDQAVFTELLAAALEVQEQVHIHPGIRVLVVDAGRLGMLIAQTLRLTGCDLKVVIRRGKPAQLLAGFGIDSI